MKGMGRGGGMMEGRGMVNGGKGGGEGTVLYPPQVIPYGIHGMKGGIHKMADGFHGLFRVIPWNFQIIPWTLQMDSI